MRTKALMTLSAILMALLGGMRTEAVLVGAVIYSVFAVWFGLVVFTHPKMQA